MALIATSNCTFSKATPNPPCDTAALILADTKAKALRVLATEETSEMFSSKAIEAVTSWTPTTVTYKAAGLFADGGCDPKAIVNQPAYTEKTINLADGSIKITKACYYKSCAPADAGAVICK